MEHGWWLASRASGIVALALVTLSVGLGLAMAGRVMRRPGLPRTLIAVHEHTALAGLIAIAVHGLTLLGDASCMPAPLDIAVPFVMDREPVWTGLGIIAGYLAAALGLSFYVRDRIGHRRWRKLHRLTLLVYVLGVAHTLGAGTTQPSRGCSRARVTGVPVLFLFVMRVLKPARTAASGGATAARPG